jgi:hypothetical protein
MRNAPNSRYSWWGMSRNYMTWAVILSHDRETARIVHWTCVAAWYSSWQWNKIMDVWKQEKWTHVLSVADREGFWAVEVMEFVIYCLCFDV